MQIYLWSQKLTFLKIFFGLVEQKIKNLLMLSVIIILSKGMSGKKR